MDANRFVEAIHERWRITSDAIRGDINRWVMQFSDNQRVDLLSLIIENHDSNYAPKIPELKKLASGANIRPINKETGESGYNQYFRCFTAYRCNKCKTLFPEYLSGVKCPECRESMQGGAYSLVRCDKKPYWSQNVLSAMRAHKINEDAFQEQYIKLYGVVP